MSINPTEITQNIFSIPENDDTNTSFSLDSTTPNLTKDEIERKKSRILLALGPKDKNLDSTSIDTMLSQGREEEIKGILASNKDISDLKQRTDILSDISFKRKNGTISDSEWNAAYGIVSKLPNNNPDTIVEKNIANNIVDKTLMRENGGLYSEAYSENSDKADSIVETTSKLMEKQQVLQTKAMELKKMVEDQSWASWGMDFAKTLFPFYSSFKSTKFNPGNNRFIGSIAAGHSIQPELLKLLQVNSLDDFKREIDTRIDSIARDNPQVALQLVQDLSNWSSSVRNLRTAISLTDIAANTAGVGKGVLGKLAQKSESVSTTGKSLVTVAKDLKAIENGTKDIKTIGSSVEDLKKIGISESSSIFDGPYSTHPGREGSTIFDGPTSSHMGAKSDTVGKAIEDLPESSHVYDLPTSEHPTPKETSSIYDLPTSMHPDGSPGRIVEVGSEDTSKIGRMRDVLEDVSETIAKPGVRARDVVAASGEPETAAKIAVITKEIPRSVDEAIRFTSGDPAEGLASFIRERIPSIANPSKIIDSAFDTSREYAKRLAKELEDNANLGLRTVRGINWVQRIDHTASYSEAAMAQGKLQVERLFGKSILNGISDVKFIPGSEMGTNVDRVRILLSKNSGIPFDTAKEAQSYGKHLGFSGESLKVYRQADNSYLLAFDHDVRETDKALHDVIFTPRTETPITTERMITGWLSSADRSLSKSQNETRSMLTSVQSELHRLTGEIGKKIGVLSKDEAKELDSLMEDAARVVRNRPDGSKTLGYFYKSPTEFSDAYYTKFGKFPSEKTTTAYFTAVQLHDIDYMNRSIDIYKKKAIEGFGEASFLIKQEGKEGKLIPQMTTPLEGRILDGIPFDKGNDARILIIDRNGDYLLKDLEDITGKIKTELQESISSGGAKVTQLFDTRSSDVLHNIIGKGSSGDPIRYVVSHDVRFGPLDLKKQLPYNEGGHHIENLNWRIKSGNIVQSRKGPTFMGETTVSGFVREHEAKAFFKGAEEARKAYSIAEENLVNGSKLDLSGVRKALEDNNMPWSAKEFHKMVQEGTISSKVPLALTRDGQYYHDVIKLNDLGIRNDIGNPHRVNLDLGTKYTGERGLGTASYEFGGSNNPVWMPVSTRMLSPRDTLQSTVSDVVNSRVFSDYLIRSKREFIDTFADTLKGGADRLNRGSLASFIHPEWNPNADPVRLSAAKRMHMAVMQLMYTPSELSKQVTAVKDRLLGLTYKFGGNTAGDYLEDSVLWKTKDPSRFLRGVAFHTQIGLFNPIQLVLNTQTLFYMSSLSPKFAASSVKDSILMRFLEINDTPEIFKTMVKRSKYTHFDEMYRELKSSGFSDINGTIAHIDDALEPKTIQSKFGKFLDTASIFFKESEGGLKRTSFSIAYKEWRDANPTKIIDDFDRQQIVGRAKNLNVQMSRDSQAMWQKGLASIPTQFLSYNLRMSEQIMEGIFSGKGALTRAEAGRAILMNSLLYGIPAGALGATVGLYPVSEAFQKYSIDNGLDWDYNPIVLTLAEGIFQAASYYSDGSKWNFSDRYAPGNSRILVDLIDGNTSLIDAAIGPSGSMITSILKSTLPVAHWIGSTMSDNPDNDYPLTQSDILDAIRNIGVLNNATRAYMAYNYGVWYNKNEVALSEVDGPQAAFASLLGLSPKEANNVFLLQQINKDHAQEKGEISKEYNKELERAFFYKEQGDEVNFLSHYKRAHTLLTLGNFNIQEKREIFQKALRGDGIRWNDMLIKNIMRESDQDKYQRKLDTLIKERSSK